MGNDVSKDIELIQKEFKRSLGCYILYPDHFGTYYSFQSLQLMSIGSFKNGRFSQYADLTVPKLVKDHEIQSTEINAKHSIHFAKIMNEQRLSLKVNNGWTTEEIQPLDLNRILIGKVIKNKKLYEIGNEIYVVYKTLKSKNFEITDQTRKASYIDENHLATFGFDVIKYKISRSGKIKVG